jgi:diaminohydroxyphosphoribosylaminopyrimidine deaminase/5-amino-6-(5-phosphoribosylamino)uracil reductase
MELAEKGRGFVSPNPVVGALLVRNGKIIAEDWHRKFGEGHAERNLLEKFEQKIGSKDTLYVSLEPCCHTNKKTKPCTDIILEKNVKKLVVGLLDPNPEVAGKGAKLLKKRGVEVVVIDLQEFAWQNRFFRKWVQQRLPWVSLKVAQSLDGRIGQDRGQQMWLTGKESRAHVHQMRAQYDAIMVGVKTVIADNPQLTVRNHRGKTTGPQPIAIILDAALSISLTSKVVRPGTLIFCGRQFRRRKSKKEQLIDKGCIVLEADTDPEGLLNLREILAELAARGISSVYVEGGPSVWNSFLSQGLADEIMIYFAPRFLGDGVQGLEFDPVGVKLGQKNPQLKFREMKILGEDVYWQGSLR